MAAKTLEVLPQAFLRDDSPRRQQLTLRPESGAMTVGQILVVDELVTWQLQHEEILREVAFPLPENWANCWKLE